MSDQAQLPTFELPEYNGVRPVGVVSKVSGAGERIARALHDGERVVLLVEATLNSFEVKDRKLVQKLKADDIFEVPGDAGKRMLTHLRQSYRQADDARQGRQSLLGDHSPVLGPKGWVDASGNLLSEEDLAELRGDSFLAAANDESLDPVQVVFVDGGRMVWPDDFGPEPGAPPVVGEFLTDSGDPRQVRQLLDVESGVVLEEWSAEQEDARLAALEDEERAREASEDAAVVAALEAHRGSAREPWPDYEATSLAGTKGIVRELTEVAEVEAVIAYEGAHKKRASVLKVAEERLAELKG